MPCDETILYKVDIITHWDNTVKPPNLIDHTVKFSTNTHPRFNGKEYVLLKEFKICSACYHKHNWKFVEGNWDLRYGQRKYYYLCISKLS